MLRHAVIVGGDRPCADVRRLTNSRVTEITVVANLDARAEYRRLQLGVVPHVRASAYIAARANVCEWTNLRAVA